MRDTTGPSNVQGGVIREVAEHQKHLQLGGNRPEVVWFSQERKVKRLMMKRGSEHKNDGSKKATRRGPERARSEESTCYISCFNISLH